VKTSNFKLQTSEKFRISNSKSCLYRLGAWNLVLLWSLKFGIWSFAIAATNSFDLDQIPPLRPPRAEIPPGFWDQYGLWVLVGCIAFLALVCGTVWLLSRPRSPMEAPPAARARQALEQLQQRPENGVVLSWVSQNLRQYLNRAFGLPPEELTTEEFCDLIAKNEKLGPGLAADIAQFFRTCDERKFSATVSGSSLGAAAEALRLLDRAEVRVKQPEKIKSSG